MLILGTLSGIQDYLFDIQETGGGQARALRARSFRIQVISESIARRLRHVLGLPDDRIVLRAAARFAIAADDAGEARRAELDSVLADIQHWLLENTQGRLRLAIAVSDLEGTAADRYLDVQLRLQRSKLIPWAQLSASEERWKDDQLVVSHLSDTDGEAKQDRDIGAALTRAKHLDFFELDSGAAPAQAAAGPGEFDAAGFRIRLCDRDDPASGAVFRDSIGRFAFHVPTAPDGRMIEFEELAGRARGAPMLGYLKADADSLGQATSERLRSASGFQHLQQLSNRLNTFFGATLDEEMRHGNERWRDVYTVFSGGDDVFVVAPWDAAIDFAGHLQQLFRQRISSVEGLTISAGLAIVRGKFPIRLAARQAEQALEQAKTESAPRAGSPKDQFAALGGNWKWQEHERIIACGRQLAEWVDSGIVQRGWLHTLLELALLRRGEAPSRSDELLPAMATARLAYHIGRIWPRQDDRDGRKQAARAWADGILREFDRYESTSHTDTVHLPAIVRYALLATRAASPEDSR